MNQELAELFIGNIAARLQRRAITRCSVWAETYRVMGGGSFPGPWTFKHHPWTRDMHDCNAVKQVGQKAAQMGFTEWALNKAFYTIDVLHTDVMYVLPAKIPDAHDFSSARFDPALELSDHLNNLFSETRNVGHKRAGVTNLYIRGSKSRSGLKSVPAGLLIFDEVDEMNLDNLPLARERASGQLVKQELDISTPTIDALGINKEFLTTTQGHFFFECPHCSRHIELTFPDSLTICGDNINDPDLDKSYLLCSQCKHQLDHQNKVDFLADGIWVDSFLGRDAKGFHIPQLYSMTISPKELAVAFFAAQKDPAAEQEFYNSKLGLPHVVEGARVTDAMVQNCIGNFKKGQIHGSKLVTAGVDVGKRLHVTIKEWTFQKDLIPRLDVNVQASCRLVDEFTVLEFDDLVAYFEKYNVVLTVIDIQPETRAAREFARKFRGYVYLCTYGKSAVQREIIKNEEELTVTVDRTSWLDLSFSRFKGEHPSISLPIDLSEEFKDHIKALVRVYEKDKHGNPFGKYVNGQDQDHFAHAANYAEIALPLACELSRNKSIKIKL